MEMSENEIRMKYAGAIGLLCECSNFVDEEVRESIAAAVEDWCEATGWTTVQTLNRIYVRPPQT